MNDSTPVTSLSEFLVRIDHFRRHFWKQPMQRELWFRGEGKRYKTPLRPELFRPQSETSDIKPINDLIEIENFLYEDFQRGALQLSADKSESDNWNWDSYFLMQHHDAPTRLLDWSDGALIALHFAVGRERHEDREPAVVYVLEPYRLKEQLDQLPEMEIVRSKWKAYIENHPTEQLSHDEWERSWLPATKDELIEVDIPSPPILLEFPHITRRVAAQRSRLMVFGRNPTWLADRLGKNEFPLKAITIAASARGEIRQQLRDAGVTESVIFPDLDGLGRELRQMWEDRRAQ